MAFPTVNDADTTSNTVASNSSSWTLTYPANIAADDLLLLFLACDGAIGSLAVSGFTGICSASGSTAVSLRVMAKKADGTETGNVTATLGASEQGAWRMFRITGWYSTGTFGSSQTGTAVTTNQVAGGGSDANPNPPDCNPDEWDIEDTLWFAACGVDTSRTISAYPYGDRNTADVSGGSGGATLGLCSTTSAAASLNPGTFTISNSDDWAVATVAVRPAAAVASNPPVSRVYPQLLAH